MLCVAAMTGLAYGAPAAIAAQDLIEARESAYNSIFIYRNPPYVSMIFGHNKRLYTESQANTTDPLDLPVRYTQFMTLPLAYRDKTETVLEIGLGGGSTIWYLHETFPGLKIKAAELDPEVVELAKKYFFVKEGPRLSLNVRDGRLFMAKSRETYDVIMIDAYRGPFVPFHLLTKEFFELAKRRLNPGGVIAQNIEPTTMLYDAAIATIASVFDNLDVYRAGFNYVVIAYDGPRKKLSDLLARAEAIDKDARPRYRLAAMIEQQQPSPQSAGQVLTDDFAPVEMLNATTRHNERLE